MTYVKLCRLDDVPSGTFRPFFVNDKEVMIINNKDELFCLDARCTHAGAPLADGKVEDDTLTCPWHGSKFRITDGSVIRGPAKIGLRVYAHMVEDGFVLVDV